MASLGLFQRLITRWGDQCFGQEVNRDVRIRRNVALEESLELFQSLEGTEEEAMKILQRTFSRPRGETDQEIGGVLVTTTLLAESLGENIEILALRELHRCEDRTEEIREKRRTKPHAQLESDSDGRGTD
jgi:hypothetical protein